jgi:hypothetical protein
MGPQKTGCLFVREEVEWNAGAARSGPLCTPTPQKWDSLFAGVCHLAFHGLCAPIRRHDWRIISPLVAAIDPRNFSLFFLKRYSVVVPHSALSDSIKTPTLTFLALFFYTTVATRAILDRMRFCWHFVAWLFPGCDIRRDRPTRRLENHAKLQFYASRVGYSIFIDKRSRTRKFIIISVKIAIEESVVNVDTEHLLFASFFQLVPP